MSEDSNLKSAWDKRIEEQENMIDELRKQLARERQASANTEWVEHDDKSL